MDNNVIYVAKYLTSARFYENFLKDWNDIEEYHSFENPITLDFSNTCKVEPLCLANILILGNTIQAKTGVPIKVYIPDTVEGGILKYYLWKIGFLANSIITKEGKTERVIFDYETSPYGGAEGTSIDPVCGTFYFEAGMSEEEIENSVSFYLQPFVEKYLKEFQIKENSYFIINGDKYICGANSEDDNITIYKDAKSDNLITQFLAETVKNSVIHGNSNAYVSLHGRHSDRKIYISVSDCGKGFLTSWIEKKQCYEEKMNSGMKLSWEEEKDYQEIIETEKIYNFGRTPSNEYEAIICGMYKRRSSKIYGLFNVIRQILECGIAYKKITNNDNSNAVVRLHSNNTQIILTERVLGEFLDGKLERIYNFDKYNVKKHYIFMGGHIEIEIPFM